MIREEHTLPDLNLERRYQGPFVICISPPLAPTRSIHSPIYLAPPQSPLRSPKTMQWVK